MHIARSKAAWRYNRRVIVCSLFYAGFLIAAVYGFKHHLVSGPIAYVAAILPAVSVIGIFVAIGRYLLEEQDEYLRGLAVRQALWASGIALSGATIWGFLENFDLIHHVDGYYVAILWFAGLGVGACVNRLQGRDGGSV